MKKSLQNYLFLLTATMLLTATQSGMAMDAQQIVEDQIQPKKPVTLFLHGHGGSSDNKRMIEDYKLPESEISAFDFANSSAAIEFCISGYSRAHAYLGQGDDIIAVAANVDADKDYILWGFSRGAAAAINYVAEHNPKNVKALVLQSGLFDAADMVDRYQDYCGLKFAPFRWMKERIVKFYAKGYPLGSTPPIQAITKITNKKLPIFITHNEGDHLIPIKYAFKFYQTLQQAGFENVYFCQLQRGTHCEVREFKKLKEDIHAFYTYHTFLKLDQKKLAKYCIKEGQDMVFSEYVFKFSLQPSPQEIAEKINIAHRPAQVKYLLVTSAVTALVAYRYRKQFGGLLQYGLSVYKKIRSV